MPGMRGNHHRFSVIPCTTCDAPVGVTCHEQMNRCTFDYVHPNRVNALEPCPFCKHMPMIHLWKGCWTCACEWVPGAGVRTEDTEADSWD